MSPCLSPRYPSDWLVKAHDAFARLAENPWTLFLVLLAVNSVTRPYAGITHDTRLYTVQVLNHVEGGTYADDLFFRYGSQDEYSIFSRLAAPLVHVLGLPAAFFLIYVISKTLLIWGMMRLVQTLVPNRTAVTLALIYCMIVSIRYGGHYILNIQETFVTPRMPAIALVLIGLDLILRGRPVLSGIVLLLAAAIHPLMAFGGLLIWAGFHGWKLLGFKAFAAASLGVCILAAVILAIEPLGIRCFGAMDDVWRQTILHASSFNFPSEWAREDWCYLAFQLVIVGILAWRFRSFDVDKARFLAVVAAVTVAGTIGSMLAERLPYALLLQGQPYRALWIAAFLHLALAFWLLVEWAQHPSQLVRLAGCGLLAYLCCFDGLAVEMLFPLFFLPFVVVLRRGLQRDPLEEAWLTRSIQISLILGGVAWMMYKYGLLLAGYDELLFRHHELRDIVEVFVRHLGPILVSFALGWGLVRFGAERWHRPGARWLAAAFCVGLQALYFVVPETDCYRDHATRYRADLVKIREVMHADRPASRPLPTVYCNLGCLDYVWLDLHAKSYFDWWQAGGFMFRREMAVEGQRRACLVAAFELARFRKFTHEMTDGDKAAIGRFFKTDFDTTLLTEKELARLCQEPNLDYILLEQRFDGLYSAQFGKLYLYPCPQVRTALGLPNPTYLAAELAPRGASPAAKSID